MSARQPLQESGRRLAAHPFWLDGGYDRESVEACCCEVLQGCDSR